MNEVNDFTKRFTDETLQDVVQLKRNFYAVEEEVMQMQKRIGKEPFAMGTLIGSGKPFHPSTALLDWLGQRTGKFVVLDKKASWLFLCGRDIFQQSIMEQKADSGLVLVKNQVGEVLGYGEFTKKKKGIAIKNLLDKGDFIRRERH